MFKIGLGFIGQTAERARRLLAVWSGWADLNRRPPRPKRGALPYCATPRYSEDEYNAVTA